MFDKIGPTSLYVLSQDDPDAPVLHMAAAQDARIPTDTHVPGETHATTEAHGGAEGHKGPFPPFDSSNFAGQLFWLAIFFGVLLFVMAKVALPRLRNIVEGRAERISSDLAEANRLKKETDDAIAAYEKTLGDARAEGHRIAADTHEKVAREADEHRKGLESELNAKLEASETQIAATKSAALGNVRGIAVDAAAAIVERLTGRPAAGPDIERAVDASLAN
ncbi:F0F1 ATP synthase subunit B' [Chelatococcus sambhunathii]|uniref:ATP synthase subunit b n=1 Tax=Chelatococcus sambhunathii TaxID=363953 RepID=A0ABU1DIB5_9HYPH|nr:F0F1 ATP synthase subunit B' [Chelatococcus sambhunathii]MDR4307868.1 F0F1 ATP synthase subunit B' [Chelatococcus sambhunathii]